MVEVEDEAKIRLIPERRMEFWLEKAVVVAAIDNRAPGVLVPMPILPFEPTIRTRSSELVPKIKSPPERRVWIVRSWVL